MAKSRKIFTLGRLEKLDLPDLMLWDIDAKVDTGAYSSSLHVHDVTEKEVDGKRMVSFQLDHPSHPSYNNLAFTLPMVDYKSIRSSSGEEQMRYIIQTKVILFGKEWETEISLADRSSMDYPVLIGRKLLAQGFVVDVRFKNRSFNKKVKK